MLPSTSVKLIVSVKEDGAAKYLTTSASAWDMGWDNYKTTTKQQQNSNARSITAA